MRLCFAIAGLLALATGAAQAQSEVPPPVAAVVDGRLPIGGTELPVFVSQDWSRPLPAIRRAVIVVHGYSRNAADYARDMMDLSPPPDTLVLVPQFLAPEDIAVHHLPDAVLRWLHDTWSGGEPALGPAPISAYDGLDAIITKLGDRAIFPNVSMVVVSGFSAGGQTLQRYAIVGRGAVALAGAGVRVRYVVGSPSSYAYFSDERPLPDGSFGAFSGVAACPDFNRWKYGFAGNLPPYIAAAATPGVVELEHRYAARDIVYLVGGNDIDPNHRVLDKTCAGEAQGPNRLARMQFFFAEMKRRDAAILKQQMWVIDGAAHNAARVFGSPCGRSVLFGEAGCSGG